MAGSESSPWKSMTAGGTVSSHALITAWLRSSVDRSQVGQGGPPYHPLLHLLGSRPVPRELPKPWRANKIG